MAQSPSHKFGQIIGDLLEEALYPLLYEFCSANALYLDYKHDRPARNGKKVSWSDKYGNKHDLDFVFEREGSEQKIGLPVGFIECAWRRYTKHSRNKVQEIQSAILPLSDTFSHLKPFLGVILAGVFTEGALSQLKSRGFSVLYFSYDTIVKAFHSVNIDAYFDESTSDADFLNKVESFYKLTIDSNNNLKKQLITLNQSGMQIFFEELNTHLYRMISEIYVFTLHGKSNVYKSINEAIFFINHYDILNAKNYHFERFEIIVKYTNGDKIEAHFSEKIKAVSFLNQIV